MAYSDPSGHFVISALLGFIIAGAIVGGTLGGITAYNSGQDVIAGILTGAILGGTVGGIIGFSVLTHTSGLISGGLSSVIGKLISDSFYTLISGENSFGTWEDYAFTFVSGAFFKTNLMKNRKALKFIYDSAVRPFISQSLKIGTRGKEFIWQNYLYDVTSNVISFSFSYHNIKSLGLDINWSKSMLRGFLGAWKREFATW